MDTMDLPPDRSPEGAARAPIAPLFSVREAERVTFGPDDIPALLVRPDAERPLPAVLVQHGLASGKEDLLPLARGLAAHGFVALLPDAWGHGERFPTSGPSWMTELHADFVAEVIRRTSDDLHTALSYMQGRDEVQPDVMLVAGFSLGAVAALVTGTEDPRVAGMISVAGSPLADLETLAALGGRPPSAATRAWAEAHDAAAHVAALAPKPLLLSHGRNDDMVPVAGTLRLHAAALPHYAEHPDRLGLRLYDHTHLVTDQQLRDAIAWVVPHYAEAIAGV